MDAISVEKIDSKKLVKYGKKGAKRLLLLFLGFYFIPKIFTFWIVCGLLDVMRHHYVDWKLLDKYFFGNGFLTWFFSPLNLLMDLLTLPFRNKGIYQLEDLPEDCQKEIQELIDASHSRGVVEALNEKIDEQERSKRGWRLP